MWVEMLYVLFYLHQFQSSSSWGCELKYSSSLLPRLTTGSSSSWGCELKSIDNSFLHIGHTVILFVRMWVEIFLCSSMISFLTVILFVRMWVEISSSRINPNFVSSSSSWGCELKYFVCFVYNFLVQSSSSWGCELKYNTSGQCLLVHTRHPLREDVSWNS